MEGSTERAAEPELRITVLGARLRLANEHPVDDFATNARLAKVCDVSFRAGSLSRIRARKRQEGEAHVPDFALEAGGPKRLRVTWGFRWKNFVVHLDGQEVGRVDGGFDALRQGPAFQLPDGSKLRVHLVMEKGWAGTTPRLHLYINGKPVPGSEAVPLPKWSYAFCIACALIPLVALGGAIPAGIGAGGAAACAAVARDESKSVSKRVLFCAGITALAWAGFAAFVAAVGTMKSR